MTTATNDIHSPTFESKLDEYFTSTFKEDRYGKYRRWDKEDVRSALVDRPRRASKFWTQGILGVKSPNTKDS